MNQSATLPYSIAVPLERLRAVEGEATSEAIEALIGLHDGIVKTLAVLALPRYLAGYAAAGPRRPPLDAFMRAEFFAKRATRGGWAELLRALLEVHRETSSAFPMPDLLAFWFKKPERAAALSEEASLLMRLVSLQNDWANDTVAPADRPRVWAAQRAELERVVDALAFLGRYHLWVPLATSPAAAAGGAERFRVTEAVSCRGATLERVRTDILLRGPVRSGEELVLVREGSGEELMRLSPMMLPDVGTPAGTDDLFVYDHNRRSKLDAKRVVRLEYVGTRAKRPYAVAAGSASSDVLASFSEQLAPWLEVGEAEADRDGADSRFRAMPALVEDAAQNVLGRDDVFARLEEAAQSAGGNVALLVGGPGAGKTSALAAFVRSGRAVVAAVHLVGSDGGRDDPRLIVRALAAQVCERFDLRRSIPDDYASALTLFHEMLRERSESGERVVIVVDGLDEIRVGSSQGPDLTFLPSPIPAGVVFLASARPGPVAGRIERICNAPHALHAPHAQGAYEHIELGSLSQAHLLAVGRSLSPAMSEAELVRFTISASGNPLFLRALLGAPMASPGDSLPASLEVAFRELIDRVAGSVRIDAERALGLLAVARSGLSRRDLATLLAESPYKIGLLLRELRSWLRESDDRYLIAHARLREWVLTDAVAHDRAARLHGDVADLLASAARAATAVREDALADLPYHLEVAGRTGDLLILVDDAQLLARKAALERIHAHRGG